MRGTDAVHHIHVTEKGDPKFVGLAYHASSDDDLAHAARLPGASEVEDIDEPGGGRRVCLTEPNGYQVEVVFGIAEVDPLPVHLQAINNGTHSNARAGEVMRLQVYDYWSDPWGRVHEHWADRDRLNATDGSNLIAAEEGLTSQWGEPPPEKFICHLSE